MYSIGSGDEPKPTSKRKKWKKQRPDWLPQAVCEDYRAGLTVHELAKKYHIASTLVSQYLHEAGLLGPKPKQTPASPVLKYFLEELLRARVLLGRAPNESEITRLMKEVRNEAEETKVR